MRSSWSLRRRLNVVLAAASVLVLLLVSVASVLLTQVHRDQNKVTNRYFVLLSDANLLFVGLLDAETAVRGYILTGDPATLQPMQALMSPEFRMRSEELRRLIGNDSVLRPALDQAGRTAQAWFNGFAQPSIDAVRERGPRAVDAAAVGAGRAQFDAFRADYASFRDAVLARRTATNESLQTKTFLLFVAVLVGALGSLSAGLLLWWILRRWVARPLEALAGETRIVSSGELDHEVSAQGPPEIIRLGVDVDGMRRRIVDQLVEVEAVRDGLQEAQQRLEAQASELQRSNRDLEQFAYVASHDLQEPLRKVASFCQLLERRYAGQLDERADQYIAFAVDGAKRMQQLINDLLAFSRIGRRTTGRDEVPLDSCAAGAVRNLEAVIEEAGATVSLDPLPVVWGEKALLTAFLQNLISNAIKFRGVEPAAVRITVEPDESEGEYVFRCSDNGIGIAPQYAERIFVIFQRLHAKDEYTGTGIGLAMCKKIVEWHGGRIWLDVDASSEGSGTTFAWTLPMVARGRALMDPTPERTGQDVAALPVGPDADAAGAAAGNGSEPTDDAKQTAGTRSGSG